MATRRTRTDPVLAVEPAGHHTQTTTDTARENALAHRTRLPRDQNRPRPGPLRRPHLARLAPPHHPRQRGARIPHPATARPKNPCAGMTLYAVLRRLQQLLAGLIGTCPTCKTRFPQPK